MKTMNVVSIMAHQDDEMRCLGTMLKCQARGDQLFFVTLTDGSGGFAQTPDISRKAAAAIRQREMAALAKAVGARYINLREHDEFLYDTPAVRRAVVEAIRATQADLIFTHWREDYNLDHTTTYSLVQQAALHSCLPMQRTKSPALKEHPAIFCIEPHTPSGFPATHFVDITPYEKRKIELLKLHASQEEAMQLAVKSGFDKLAPIPDAYWGQKAGCEYAECFVALPARGAVKPFPVLP
jgi:LmbE family N-acetylglucosaminyl deacetylase